MKIVSKAAAIAVVMGAFATALTAHAEPLKAFSASEVALEAAFALSLAADRSQTLQLHGFCNGRQACDLHETNLFLGRDPSRARINNYFLGAAIGHTLVTALMNPRQRLAWQASSLALELAVIGHNKRLGLRVSF